MSWTCMQSLSFIPLMISEEKIFEYFFKNLPFMLPWQPIKFSDLDKIHMNRRRLLKKLFCKKNLNICSETANVANFHFSRYKSMETISCHSNQSSYPIRTKTKLFVPRPLPKDATVHLSKSDRRQWQISNTFFEKFLGNETHYSNLYNAVNFDLWRKVW